MRKTIHIGLTEDRAHPHGRGIFRGVANFADSSHDYEIIANELPDTNDLPDLSGYLKQTPLDGIIGSYIPDSALHRQISSLGLPMVDVHDRCCSPRIPVIATDSEAMMNLALQFFLQSGFHRLAFCGYPTVYFSDIREQIFLRHASEISSNVSIYALATQEKMREEHMLFAKDSKEKDAELVQWLVSLSKPVAIFACNDVRGRQVIDACRIAGIKVPEEVAVLGVDNDRILCRLVRPTLSSIEMDVEKIGFLATQAIIAQLEGKAVTSRLLLPPRQLVQRESTDTVVAANPVVMKAARLIRDRNYTEASVEQICEQVGVSRSWLDSRFLADLGRSIAADMAQIRLNRAQFFLRNTDLSLAEIAQRCGFSSTTHFCRFFKRKSGQTPLSYRES